MSRTKWVPAVVVGLIVAGCQGAQTPPADASREARLASLDTRIEASRRAWPAWESWFADLERLGVDDHAANLYHRAGTGRVLYGTNLMAEITEGTVPSGPGPLATILYLARQLEAAGVDLLLLPIPPRESTYPDLLGIPTPLGPGETPPLLDLRLREFYRKLEESGIEVVDLQPAFLARRFRTVDGPPSEPGPFTELLFRRQDTHWTTYGASVAAEVVAEHIRRYLWFAEAKRRFGEARVVEESRWQRSRGSIARRLVEAGRLDPDSPVELFLERRAVVRGEQWSWNDRTSPIVIIGDSFSNPVYGFADHLLKELGFRVDLMYVPGGIQRSSEALRLRGDGLAGKRLLIWEFASFALASPRMWQTVDVIGRPRTFRPN